MRKSMKEERIGEIIKGENGTCAIITGWRNTNDITVMFTDGTFKTGQYHNFLRSLVHPKKTVKGIAYRGNTTDLNVQIREEQEWHNMLSRCYHKDGTVKVRENGFIVTVCERWLCLENFVKDIRQMKHYNEWLECEDNTKADGWHLDKDMGCFFQDRAYYMIERVYSPNTCHFVPTTVNQRFRAWIQDRFYSKEITSIILCYEEDVESHVKSDDEKTDYQAIEMEYKAHKSVLDGSQMFQEQKQRHLEKILAEQNYFKSFLE